MHYFAQYSLFFAKALTLLIIFFCILIGMIAILARNKINEKSQLIIQKLNDHYISMESALKESVLTKKNFKAYLKQLSQTEKEREKNDALKKIYVLNFNGDIRASAVEHLREEITGILSIASPEDEIVVCLESPGGMVQNYGLAASQLQRIKDKKIPLTVIIDKVAASGGYLMACVADRIIAAPFSIIGSIGVIAQLPNFHRWLQKNNIDFEQITAGQYKRTLSVFGENTETSREKMQESLEEIHHYFKTFITTHRPGVNIDQVATGEHWLGVKALDLNLVDRLQTSDDYLFAHYKTAEIFNVKYQKKKTFSLRLMQIMEEKAQHIHQLLGKTYQ